MPTGPVCRLITPILVLFASAATAATLNVPSDHPTIQSAIDAAQAGDEIVVAAGVYHESIAFKEDHVLVRSSQGAESTILDGSQYQFYALAYFGPYSSGELQGFTLRNYEHPYSGAVTVRRSNARVVNCIFEDNRNYFNGAALRIDTWSLGDNVDIEVRGCTFRFNESGDRGGALSAVMRDDDELIVADCVFEDNTSDDGGHMLLARNGPGGNMTVQQCTFRNGHGDTAGAVIMNEGIGTEGYTDAEFLGCTFEDHDGAGIRVHGEVVLRLDAGTFSNTGTPAVDLLAPSVAQIADSGFCGAGVAVAGNWTDLGGNTFDSLCYCTGDGNGDGQVNVNDLLHLLSAFGTADSIWDLDESGMVDVGDVLTLIAAWGPC